MHLRIVSSLRETGMASDIDIVAQRNLLRRDAGLPELDISAELMKLEAARATAAFEEKFESNRHRFQHLWTGKNLGWLSKMGLWNEARKRFRDEFVW
jgi:hypothetical protein